MSMSRADQDINEEEEREKKLIKILKGRKE